MKLVVGSSEIRRLSWCVVALVLGCLSAGACAQQQDWKSGQDSPVHDADRLYPLGSKQLVLENDKLRVAFDEQTGAFLELTNKVTGWHWETRPELAESFNLFVPTADRSYNPVLGARNTLASFKKSVDGTELQLTWSNLQSEYQGTLEITLQGHIRLEGDSVSFSMIVTNKSQHTIASLSWPIVGSLAEPSPVMKLSTPNYGGLSVVPLWNPASQASGYYGTNFPTRILGGSFILISTPSQGLYVSAHNPDSKENVRYMFEVKPGFASSFGNANPKTAAISGHPVRLTMQVVHYPFLNPGESSNIAPIVLATYSGDWHAGADIHKRWLSTWYHPLPMPSWATDVHAWQQLQINSSEDDLRTHYVDLAKRVADDRAHGITALQLVGWNKGGQDRDNPSNDVDPRLGTAAELKDAIAQIERSGVHVVLFAKYAWADTTTDWYKNALAPHMASDPFGNIYTWAGYRYQTPEQLTGINTRNFATGCTNDMVWRGILAKEFQKIIDMGADGVLFDEAQHRHSSDYNLCFNPQHGHHVPASIWSGDIALAGMFRNMIRDSVGENKFLFSGEDPEDVISDAYSLSYFRIGSGHIPEERYVFPWRPLMVAVTGFDDRAMINHALMYRYILSYEPFNFKGDIQDFPLTLAYGEKVDALRTRYRDYLWDAEFRDTLPAKLTSNGMPYTDYSVFIRKDGLRAAVIVNDKAMPIRVSVQFAGVGAAKLVCATPEHQDTVPCSNELTVPPESAVVAMEQPE